MKSSLLCLLPLALSACTLLAPIDEHSSAIAQADEERPIYYFQPTPIASGDADLDVTYFSPTDAGSTDAGSDADSFAPVKPACQSGDASICQGSDPPIHRTCNVHVNPPPTCTYKGMQSPSVYWYCCQT